MSAEGEQPSGADGFRDAYIAPAPVSIPGVPPAEVLRFLPRDESHGPVDWVDELGEDDA